MKPVLNAAVAFAFGAFLLAANARAQTTEHCQGTMLSSPGILVTPPMALPVVPAIAPPVETQQSCPASGHKLDLIS